MCVQSYALFLADVLNNFLCTCLEIYELDPAHSCDPRVTWQAAITIVKVGLLTDNDML